MTQEEFDKAPLLDQILYDTTGMLVENHPSIAEAMDKYHQAKLKYAKVDFLAGYNEALRWRDPINDPPKCNDLMQIKSVDIFSNIINYEHDRYIEDAGMWGIEQLANIKVLAWRPIR